VLHISDVFGLDNSVGDFTINRTTILWTVEKITEWDTSAICYYINAAKDLCCTSLPVTVHKPPDSVSISFRNHSGPLLEGHQYTLQCEVHNVAPVQNLTVTFYRGQTVLGQLQSNNTEKKPVTEIFTLSINTRKEDDGVQYWCEAKLKLGPEGPQPPPVVTSEKFSATVNSTPAPETTPSTSSTPTPNCSHLWFPDGGTGYQMLSEVSPHNSTYYALVVHFFNLSPCTLPYRLALSIYFKVSYCTEALVLFITCKSL
uniref:Ig-like domain-containing protein n=1 Tax=Lates calcarifer TaxID=8187 RepID=A0A4W6BYN8_LATCA